MRKNTPNPYKLNNIKKDKIIGAYLIVASVLTIVFTIWAANILLGPKEVKTKTVTEDIALVEAEEKNALAAENNVQDNVYKEDNTLAEEEPEHIPASKAEEAPVLQSFQAPLKGEVILEFSSNIPVYSQTMDDWRVHNGIDIKAPLGSEVYAISDGVVESTYKDFKLGHTVVIDHGNGLKSIYSNLAGTDIMKVGRSIQKGDAIALLGDTALYEVSSPVHLHLEMLSNGQYVNPLDYFSTN